MKSSLIAKISYITVLSVANSILNFVFQLVIAKVFGVGTATDVFFLAFSVPEWVMNITLFIIPVTVIPAISGLIAKGEETKAWNLINSLLTLLVIILGSLVAILFLLNDQISNMVCSKLSDTAKAMYRGISVFLSPVILFSSLTAVLTGIYYSYNNFLIPSLSPLVQSSIMIAGVLLLNKQLGIKSAAVSMLTGAMAQFTFLLFLFRNSRFAFKKDFLNNDVKMILKLMIPLLIGNVILKSEVLVDRYLASFLAAGSISYLFYASRITRLLVRMTSQGVYTIFFPQLSKAFAKKDNVDFQKKMNDSMRLVVFFVLIIFAFMLLFGKNMIYVLFANSRFTMQDVIKTSLALTALGGVLLAYPLNDILNTIYYSIKDTRTPIIISTIFFIIGVFLKLLFLNIWGYIGIAAGSSIVAILTVIMCMVLLKQKRKEITFKYILKSLKQNLISFFISLLCLHIILRFGFSAYDLFSEQKLIVLSLVLLFSIIFTSLYVTVNALSGNGLSKSLIRMVIGKKE